MKDPYGTHIDHKMFYIYTLPHARGLGYALDLLRAARGKWNMTGYDTGNTHDKLFRRAKYYSGYNIVRNPTNPVFERALNEMFTRRTKSFQLEFGSMFDLSVIESSNKKRMEYYPVIVSFLDNYANDKKESIKKVIDVYVSNMHSSIMHDKISRLNKHQISSIYNTADKLSIDLLGLRRVKKLVLNMNQDELQSLPGTRYIIEPDGTMKKIKEALPSLMKGALSSMAESLNALDELD
jgi:hypothetical protein